jgi:RimJ/RimL family protein N-acetyltransferase/predicted enzyme related to lactoylglutathione lyase
MELRLNRDFTISDITLADKHAFVEHFVEKQIADQTLNIPYPYTEADAESWIQTVTEETRRIGRSVNWAIRNESGSLIGGIGFHGLDPGKTHQAEIGYWLAKGYWRRGIMSEAVEKVTAFGFQALGLSRITAHVFHFNHGSAGVLRKAGYQLEGYLRQHYRKNGKTFDGMVFSRLRESVPRPMLDRLEFVYLFVQDIPRSKAWYEKVLATPPSISEEFFVEFRLGAHAICLHPADEKSPLTTGGSVGYWRANPFGKTLDHFTSHGAELYRGPLDIGDGTFICQVKDPFGNVLGLTGRG